MALKIQVWFFWLLMLCSVVVGYQCFRGPCCLQCEMMVSYHNTTWHCSPEELRNMSLDLSFNVTVIKKLTKAQ